MDDREKQRNGGTKSLGDETTKSLPEKGGVELDKGAERQPEDFGVLMASVPLLLPVARGPSDPPRSSSGSCKEMA